MDKYEKMIENDIDKDKTKKSDVIQVENLDKYYDYYKYSFKINFKNKFENTLTKIDSVFKQTVIIKKEVFHNQMILKNNLRQTN